MEFENITYAPIDLDGIDPEQMSPHEKQMLNDYHKKVYEVLSPYMTEEENEWLKKVYPRNLINHRMGLPHAATPLLLFL